MESLARHRRRQPARRVLPVLRLIVALTAAARWFAGVDDEKIVGALPSPTREPLTPAPPTSGVPTSAQGLTPSGVWGGKLMWNQTPLLIARTRASGSLRTALRWLLGTDPLFVHVHRDDLVAQAVSMWRAVQTRVWRTVPNRRVSLARASPTRRLLQRRGYRPPRQHPRRPGTAMAGMVPGGIEPFRVEFGDLVKDPTGHDGACLSGTQPKTRRSRHPPLKPQSNARSKEWAQRYPRRRQTERIPAMTRRRPRPPPTSTTSRVADPRSEAVHIIREGGR